MGVVSSHRLGGTKDCDLTQKLTCAPLSRYILRIMIVGWSRSSKSDGNAHERLGDTETSALIEERSRLKLFPFRVRGCDPRSKGCFY